MGYIANVPRALWHSVWTNRSLIYQLTKREVAGRYRGSYLGLIWSFLIPLLMLSVYTFVFGIVFKSRWSTVGHASTAQFALILFCGMIAYNLFAEIFTRSPSLIVGNVNYVKKVVFPLEVLPVVAFLSALVHALISVLILVVGTVLIFHTLYWTMLLLPVVLVPLSLLTLAVGWILSALGVYVRDITHVAGIAISAIMFMTPIFYPESAVPQKMITLLYLNPLTGIVDNMRQIMIWGKSPNWTALGVSIVVNLILFMLGFIWFDKVKGGFADVL